ncbi:MULTISPECIES: hypothetical protein [Rossellomorea]|uniref:Uncharacterized protein n=1 Tax=Rossellomorea vietnamensis TaxID=218284 RepID=A0A6I6UTT6_9BACI|nr:MULTISPECIES: hypothetical protein [Rossellomorea]QHE62563.1 hypothetical protein FHE72_17190 [Rossellomorea vietnamensis]WGG44641.1 hypothetical protein P8596_17980 [Rossellomorea sp. DA94]
MSEIEKVDQLLQQFIKEVPTLDNGFSMIEKYTKSVDVSVELRSFRNLLTDGYKEFEVWLNGLFEKENVPDEIIALNFGLFEREDGIQLYITGSSEWEIDDEDWASNNDYFPEGRYPSIKLYNELYNLYEDNFSLRLFTTISSTIILANNYLLSHPERLPKDVVFATGFDDGVLYLFARKTEDNVTSLFY